MWIKRKISEIWTQKQTQPIRILVGPRQCGKSSFLHHVKTDAFREVTLDDINFRDIAARDPRLFLDQLGTHAIIDEAQYAADLFPELKRRIDTFKRARVKGDDAASPAYWLTGSNRIMLDREVSESLTGRASYFRLHTLSVSELTEAGIATPLEDLMMRGGWPELWAESTQDATSYLNDHIDTTLVKDLVRTAGVTKINEYVRFLRLLAGRVGNLFVASEIARDAGVKSVTISEWTSFVERMMYAAIVPAYAASVTTRLIKAPKVYFYDVALATRLQGWASFQPLFVSPNIGGLFENLVFCEIVKARDHRLKSWDIAHYRTKEKDEIDFIVTSKDRKLAIECKLSSRAAADYSPPASASKIKGLRHIAVSFEGGPSRQGVEHVGLANLSDFLADALD